MSSASAPGKIILFGEHAVVYGHPALAVPVIQVHTDVEVRPGENGILIDAPDIGFHGELSTLPEKNALRTVVESTLQQFNTKTQEGMIITITSSIPVASGLGSGAAASIATIRALAGYLGCSIDQETVNRLAFDVEKIHHGTPSGIDNTVITYSRPVYFVKNQPIQTLEVGQPFTLVIGDTGITALTKESVGDVRALWQNDPGRWEKVFSQVGKIVQQARSAIYAGKLQEMGSLMDQNHALLQEMTVSSAELDHLVAVAKNNGALGAKLSGGGRGGNMIALARPESAAKIAAALAAAGARRTIISVVE